MPNLGIYTYAMLQRILNVKIHGRRANLTSGENGDTNVERDLINSAVRIALSDIDFRGNIREVTLSPSLMENQFDYAIPNDVKADKIIDLRPENTDSRGEFESYDLTTPEEFDRRKKFEKSLFTILNNDLARSLRVSADIQDQTEQISALEDTSWNTFDSTSVNDSDVKTDNDDYIEGAGSVRFQTDTTDSTDSAVGIQNTTISQFDISPFLARGSAFVDAKIQNFDTGIHQLTLRIGSDSNNFYQVSDSTQNDCSSFRQGWNKVRFDFQSKSVVGTPQDTAIDYAALFWSRDTTTVALLHLNDTDWAFDNLVLKRGKFYLLSYYSRFAWQDTGTGSQLLENSANDSQTLMVQNDELEVIMEKAAEIASQFLRDYDDLKYHQSEYMRLKQLYLMSHPSQAKVMTTTYHDLGSLEAPPNKFISEDS